MIIFLFMSIILLPNIGHATTRYVDNALSVSCTSNNYSVSSRTCTGSDGNAYTTIAAGVAATVAGDTLYLRNGTYSEQMNLQEPTAKNGTAGNPITIGGYPGDSKPTLNGVANAYGLIKARGLAYLVIQDMILDGINMTTTGGIWVAYGNHDVTYQRLEIKNQNTSGFYIDSGSYRVVIKDNYIHDARTDCAVGHRWYAAYIHTADTVTFTGNYVENMPGGGIQLYPGNVSNTTIKGNVFKNVSYCQTSNLGGILIGPAAGNTVNNTVIADNLIYHLGYAYGVGSGGYANGITVDSRGTTSNTLIANNTIYDLHRITGGQAYGILIRTNLESGLVVRNNLIAGTDDNAITNSSSSATISYNACLSSKNCGTTGKVTIAAITDCTVSTSNLRLKQGTNPCRDAGTTSTARTNPVGSVDIGAYEQGTIASASVVSGYIEAIMRVTSPGVQPSTGLTGFTASCVGCTGTPVVSSAVVKAGSQNIVQLTISGITVNGTCTISLGSTNVTDTYQVGGPNGSAQGINSFSGQSVSGTCQNTSGGGGGGGGGGAPGGLWSDFQLDEGSGTTANDASGMANHGTVSAGVTWVTGGVTIPTDTTYRSVTSTYGSGINPTTQSYSICAYVLPDVSNSQKVVMSSTTNGTNQRAYVGWYTVGGQPQWGIGVQSSGFTSGSEFVATNSPTLVCLVNDDVADTATLYVNGVAGTGVGSSVKTETSYTLTGNFIAGNDGTNTINNGGVTIYEMWVYNKKLSAAEVTTLYTSLSPASPNPACLGQNAYQFQRVYAQPGGDYPFILKPDGTIDVVANGGVSVMIQVNCTGSAGSSVSLRPYYSTDGVNFSLPIPQLVGTGNIGMWGTDDPSVNTSAITTCLSAGGLTEDTGYTVLDSVVGPVTTMAQNHCMTTRWVIRTGPTASGTTIYICLKSDSGADLANGCPLPVKFQVVAARVHGGF